jgi:hypothetical protein
LGGSDPMSLSLPGRSKLKGSLLDNQEQYYMSKLAERKEGIGGVDQTGWGGTTDATTKYLKGMVNRGMLLPPVGSSIELQAVYWNLKSTRKVKTKGNDWQAQDLMDFALEEDNPFDPKGLYYFVLDGGCRHSFASIESKFKESAKTSNAVCQWCSTHGIQKLLEAFAAIDGVAALICDCKFVITFGRNHSKVVTMLDKFSPRKGFMKWGETRMGTLFIAMERIEELRDALGQMFASSDWSEYASGTNIKDTSVRASCRRFEKLLQDPSFYAKITVVMLFTEPVFTWLRITDSRKPTTGIMNYCWLDLIAVAEAWEKVKLKKVDGVKAFDRNQHKMLSSAATALTDTGTGGSWTTPDMANARWKQVYDAGEGRGGWFQSAGMVLNPAFRQHDYVQDSSNFVREDFAKYIEYVSATETDFEATMKEFEDYMLISPSHDLFQSDYCDYEKTKGFGSFQFWRDLPYRLKMRFPKLRILGMKTGAATSSESDSERHFSAAKLHQPVGRATMGVEHVGRLVFCRQAIMAEISEEVRQPHTAEWLEKLDADGLLELNEMLPPPPPPPAEATAATNTATDFASIAANIVADVMGSAAG